MLSSVCVVGGLGKMGGFHAKRLEQEHPNLDIQIYDSKQKTDMPDCDAYIVATPSETHYKITKSLIEDHKHVLVEKPMALDSLEAIELWTIAEENRVTLLPGHTQRYNPAFTNVEDKLRGADYLDFIMHVPHNNDPKNLVFDLMIHELELAFHLIGVRTTEGITIEDRGDTIEVKLAIGGTPCTFSVAYNSQTDIRSIESQNILCDLHVPGKSGQDALYYLHNRFLTLCVTGETPSDVKSALSAIVVAEKIQEELYG